CGPTDVVVSSTTTSDCSTLAQPATPNDAPIRGCVFFAVSALAEAAKALLRRLNHDFNPFTRMPGVGIQL
ncbi:hypothetical protein, partial [Pseudomonas aeruginosa]